MRGVVPALLIGSLAFGAIMYVNATNPDLLSFVYSTTTPAPPPTEEAPQDRNKRINALVISSQNKQDLRAGRPFWGAAQHMVSLAMNSKADHALVNKHENIFYEFQIYNFDQKRDPLIFEFHDNKLVCVHYPATKTSNCAPRQISYYGNNVPFDQLN